MKRDLDFHQDFNTKLADENHTLKQDVECLTKHLEMRDKEHAILNKQIRGLQEDNDRIAKMLQLVQNVREGKPSSVAEEVSNSNRAWEQIQMKDKKE